MTDSLDTKKETKTYTMGIRLGDSKDKKQIGHAHATVAYLGNLTEAQIGEISTEVAKAKDFLPVEFKLGEKDMSGPKNDIAVRHLSLLSEEADKFFRDIYEKWGQPEPHHKEKDSVLRWHVSMRNDVDGIIAGSDTCWGIQLFIKPLGPHDPIFRVEA